MTATTSGPARYCSECGARLASDNPDSCCGPCQREAREASRRPPKVPPQFWDTDQMRDALANRHMGKVIRAYRRSPHHNRAISQETMAEWLGLSQTQIARIESGTAPLDLGKLARWAKALGVPQSVLWFDLPPESGRDRAEPAETDAAATAADVVMVPISGQGGQVLVPIDRRTLLRGGASAFLAGFAPTTPPPTTSLDDLQRLGAAFEDAHRYMDSGIVDFFRRQLSACANADGSAGPRHSLATVLGLVGAIENNARQVKPAVRRELLGVGSRAAEFAGWLYRDVGVPTSAEYWRDRAIEWALAAGDYAMQGYVLLKKSQAAWDDRDAVRMLTLAQAAQEGPWPLPAKVRAEVAQQEARGHAMIGEDLDMVERKLDEAHELLAANQPEASGELGTHYGEALLAMQTALCYSEAGAHERAAKIYRQHLTEPAFSRRDYGYFLALMSGTLAAAGEPDEAASTGLRALSIAQATSSTRTIRELLEAVNRLEPWRGRASVRDLREAVLA